MSVLTKKIDRAIRLLRQIPRDKGPIELDYSGGKDSDCILRLVQMAGIPFDAIYKNPTIDRYMDTHPTSKIAILSRGDPYKAMCFHLLCDNYGDAYDKLEPGLFGVPDYKGFLERTAGIDLTI